MVFQSRLPIPQNTSSARPLNRMRSEGHLTAIPECTLRPLRSMGQLSSAPDGPLPSVPLRSPLRPRSRACGIESPLFLHDHGVQQNSPSLSSSSSGSYYSQDDENHHFGCNTMLIQGQSDQTKVEFTLRRNSKRIPDLGDLSNILQLRGRLQEMGTTFTPEGEILTYGNPPLNADLEQMLRLGTWYDEQWNLFFNNDSVTKEVTSDLWADLEVLKKMLKNEGITFDHHHKRLNYGASHPKLIRLSGQYDVLREEWLAKTLQNVHPADRPQRRSLMQEEVPTTPTNLGWNFLYDENEHGDQGQKTGRGDSCLKIVVEEQLPGNGPGPTIREGQWLNNSVYPSPPTTSKSQASLHGIADEEKILPSAEAPLFITRSRGRTIGAPALLHDSSPLQVASTASMLLRDAEFEARTMSNLNEVNEASQGNENWRPKDAGVLALLIEDEQRRADERQRVEVSTVVNDKKKGKKSKGVRKWLRAVLGRKKDPEQ